MKFKGIKRKSKQARQPTQKKSSPTKTKQVKQEFPNIYRIITEKARKTVKQPRFWIAMVTAFFLICLLLIVYLVFRQVQELRNTLQQRSQSMMQLRRWEAEIIRYPSYRDAYVGASVIAYELGDFNKSRQYIERALEIDPNNIDARRLDNSLKKKGD